MFAGGAHVPDDQEHAVYGAGLHIHRPLSQMDRARRPRGGQLNEAEVVADPVVNIHREAHLLRIEVSGTINIRDRDRHDLYLPIQNAPFIGQTRRWFPEINFLSFSPDAGSSSP